MRRDDVDYATVRHLVEEWRRDIAPNYFGDYYPLSPYSPDDDVWMVWQFDRPEVGRGMVQGFRRSRSIYEAARFPLHGLDIDAVYAVTDLDRGETVLYEGRELATRGLRVDISARPGSAVIVYEKQSEPGDG